MILYKYKIYYYLLCKIENFLKSTSERVYNIWKEVKMQLHYIFCPIDDIL